MKTYIIKDIYNRPRVFRAEAVLELIQEREFRLFGLSVDQIIDMKHEVDGGKVLIIAFLFGVGLWSALGVMWLISLFATTLIGG
jgi:hypothetical protein